MRELRPSPPSSFEVMRLPSPSMRRSRGSRSEPISVSLPSRSKVYSIPSSIQTPNQSVSSPTSISPVAGRPSSTQPEVKGSPAKSSLASMLRV